MIAQGLIEKVNAFKEVLPRRLGCDLQFYISKEKALVLLIDDKALQTKESLDQTIVPPDGAVFSGTRRPLNGCFDIEPYALTLDEHVKVIGEAFYKSIPKPPHYWDFRRFDLILLDLCLGEKQSVEPGGYHLLPMLRKFFPDIPIIAFTRFSDMRYIERAFSRGATWFLPKDEAWKLPEHFLERVQNRNWRQEWLAVASHLEWDLPVGRQFDEEVLYLIWKAIEAMPGGRIYVRELSGGIGGAQTLHVAKEINGRYGHAAPVVIKIDNHFRMLMERERYQRFIHPYLSNLAGRIEQPVAAGGADRASISYSYAGTSQGLQSAGCHGREVLPLENLSRKWSSNHCKSKNEPVQN